MIVIAALQAAPEWDRNTMGDTEANLEAVNPGQYVQGLDAGKEPGAAPPARVGFRGLRTPVSLERFVSAFMPGLPEGPPIIIANRRRPSSEPGQPAVMPVRSAVVPVQVVSTEQTAPWYEHLA